jgi:hypothetical protein
MKDELIIKLTNETVRHLGNAISVSSASHMIPSYNAILVAAQTNHPNHPFLSHLQPLGKETNGHGEPVSVAEMTALFAQISISLESLSGN